MLIPYEVSDSVARLFPPPAAGGLKAPLGARGFREPELSNGAGLLAFAAQNPPIDFYPLPVCFKKRAGRRLHAAVSP